MKHMKFLMIVMLGFTITACEDLISERGNGNRVEKTFTVDSFDEIELSGAYEVTLVPTTGERIIIETDENLLDYINIKVQSGKLSIGSERSLSSAGGILLEIPANKIKSLSSSGASNIKSKELLKLEDLHIELSGAGKIDLILAVEKVKIELSGAALVYLEGSGTELDVEMSGAGSLEAEGFEVANCSVNISGVGNAMVNVTGSLEAQVSGLGSVEYIGNPESVRGDVSGIGEVEKGRK